MTAKKTCKICNENQFSIYPNGKCQKCLSIDMEKQILSRGKGTILGAENLINDKITCSNLRMI